MKTMKYLFLFPLLILISCGVKQPIDQTIEQKTGSIFITSTPAGGAILLDRRPTQKTTPDTLFEIPLGIHTVHVVMPEFSALPDSHIILVEENKVHGIDFTLEKISQVGSILIATVPEGAAIFVDGQPTGQRTPDTLILEAGGYDVEARKNGFITAHFSADVVRDTTMEYSTTLDIQQRVLLEGFANVSCAPCVEASHNLDQFREQTDENDYVMIEYYANWPSPNDPFYKVAPQDVMKRVMYYGLTTLPSLFIGGDNGVDASQFTNIENTFLAEHASQNSTTALSLSKQLIDGQLDVTVDVYQFNLQEYSDNLRLFVAIIENDIHLDAPPGSNGLVDFHVVFRGFLSANSGDAIQAAEQQEFSYSMPWPAFQYDNSHVVAFVQNISTKEIIQTTIN